jgi:Fe-S-cluster-containing dehydrogenase component
MIPARPAIHPATTECIRQEETEMQKSLHIDPDECTGCLQCAMACSYQHCGLFNPSRSVIGKRSRNHVIHACSSRIR